MTDLLWADPFENKKDAKTLDFKHNDLRNISCFFGLSPVNALLKKEKLISIVRAHQVKPKGYEFHDWEGSFPPVITIFSAPNYEGLENDAAVLISTDKGGVDVKTFNENPDQPSIYEDNLDMFTLMQPKMESLIMRMFSDILAFGTNRAIPGLAKSISRENSIDFDYMKKIIESSNNAKEPAQQKAPTKIQVNLKNRKPQAKKADD